MNPRMIATAILATTLAASTTALAGGNSGMSQLAQNQSGATGTATGGMDSQRARSAAAAPGGNSAAPVVVLVPTPFAQDEKLANGCWARLYDSSNYEGNMLTLVGPVEIPDGASSVANFEFGRKYDSVAVGRSATLTVWDEANYQDRTAVFRPGQTVADLDERMGFFEEIKSLKLTCAQQGQRPQQ